MMISAKCLAASLRDFDVGRGALFDIARDRRCFRARSAAFLQLVGHFHDYALHQGGAADRLLHAQLAAFHAAGQIDFAFASEQRNGAHFAEVHADRVVGVDGLFNRRRVQEIRFVSGFRIEEFGVFFEI